VIEVYYKSSLLEILHPRIIGNDECLDLKYSFSQVSSSFGKFLHLIRYSLILLEQRILVQTSKMHLGSSTNFPSSSTRDKSVYTRVDGPNFFFKQETWKTSCNIPFWIIHHKNHSFFRALSLISGKTMLYVMYSNYKGPKKSS
jgi:hypothetical protein